MQEKSLSEIQEYLKDNKESKEFFKAYANISEEALLLKINEIYSKALNIHSYRCLRTLKFLAPRIVNNPFYEKIVLAGKEQTILDIGCALGTDLRKMYLDGSKRQKLYGLDLENGFIELGYELFNDKEATTIHFLTGNILEKETVETLQKDETWDIIYSSSVIHLLEKTEIIILLQHVYDLLPNGGIFFGQTTGLKEPQERLEKSGRRRYLHSKNSLLKEFEAVGYRDVKIEVREHDRNINNEENLFNGQRNLLYFYAQK